MVRFGLIAGVCSLAITMMSDAYAQVSDDVLVGRWQTVADSVFIEFSEPEESVPGSSLVSSSANIDDPSGSGKAATIVRDDWNPQRVGMVHIFDIKTSGRKTWNAQVRLEPDAAPKPARLKLISDSQLAVRTLSGRRTTLKFRKIE